MKTLSIFTLKMTETIFDPLRKKYVARTPEEVVRQKTIIWLNQKKGYSLNLMMSEYSFRYNGLSFRADIVVFNREMKPEILVECKAPGVVINSAIIDQGIRYNKVLNVKYIIFTNGTSVYCFEKKGDTSDYEALMKF